MPLVDVDEVLVDPAVGEGPVGIEGLAVVAASDVLHGPDSPTFDVRPAVAVLGRQPRSPEVGRFDDMVVDAHDLGELLGHGPSFRAGKSDGPSVYQRAVQARLPV